MLFRGREQIVICIVAGMFAVDFALFGCLPLQKRLKNIANARAGQRLVITKASAQSRKLPALKEQLYELKRTVGGYEAKVPDQRSLGVFLHRIADLMKEHNLREQAVRPGKEVEMEGLKYIPVSMQCKGRLKEIFQFFSSLQALDRLVRIEQVKLENDKYFNGEVSMQTETFICYRSEAGQG